MSEKLFLIFSFLYVLTGEPCLADEFTFQGFQGAHSKIYLNGDAEIKHSGILKLTGDSTRLVGHAFYDTPIRFKNSSHGEGGVVSFSTSFAFAIVPEYDKLGGHGFAFTVSKSREMLGALPSQYLGLMDSDDLGNSSNHVFAIEFDTVQDFEFGDISDNHVGIDLNSLASDASVNATYLDMKNSKKEEVSLKSGRMIQAWIDYDSSRQQVDVTLSLSSSKPPVSILTYPVNLSQVFMDFMYVGFSASTGLLASSHYISGWSFTTKGESNSLDLSLLPSIPGPKPNLHLPLILGTSLSVAALSVVTIFCIVKKTMNRDSIESWEHEIGPHRFSYNELKKATKGFRDKDLLGFGGFGRVYKGNLPNSNKQVAVKRINHESKQGLREFVSEIESIGRLRHRNLVFLQGWCRHRGDLMLVYDFMPNGSLDKHLFDEPRAVLSWDQRFNIVKGIASGLLYLHEEWEQTVIHRDIKAGNVLLDSEMNGRLGDFGLAKLYEHGQNPSTTKVVGTLGYLAPELTKTGKPTTSSDVFAFGAVLLEVVCGRRPIEAKAMPEELFLVDLVWDKWKQGSVFEVVDPRLGDEYDEVEVVLVIKLGLMCSNNAPSKRPTMRQVASYLDGEVAFPDALEAPDESGSKKPEADAQRFGDFTSSTSSKKVSSWSTEYNGEGDADVETGLVSLL